jgi:hypothetical protein
MTSWADFEAADPELAALGRSRFDAAHLALIGTIRPEAVGVTWDLALGRIRISQWSPSGRSKRTERTYP